MPQTHVVRTPSRRRQLKYGLAANLRLNATASERKLWFLLRGKRMANFRFRRQQPIGPYIVDFLCPAAKLVVELDGNQHGEVTQQAYDEARTRWLADCGYRVLRFGNGEVQKNVTSVLDSIERAVIARTPCGENAASKPSP